MSIEKADQIITDTRTASSPPIIGFTTFGIETRYKLLGGHNAFAAEDVRKMIDAS